jgi:iron(III) transport system permease protein
MVHTKAYTPTIKNSIKGWTLITGILTLVMTLPLWVIVASWFFPKQEIWQHLVSTVLFDYIFNSLLLMLGVGIGVSLLGVSTAWLVSMCNFPIRRLFEWALMLPMAIPAYILAYTYTDFLQFSGPLQTGLRNIFGWSARDYWFPDSRSLGGAIIILSLVLYPYVYALARNTFLEQPTCILEAGQSLRCHPWQSFFRISLPMARPAIGAGVTLALMEALSDFGTVDYFGVPTFTTGIYRTFFGLGESLAAAQLAACLLVFVVFLLVLERYSRKSWQHKLPQGQPFRYELKGWRALLAIVAVALPIFLGFILPLGLLIEMASNTQSEFGKFIFSAGNSLFLALVSCVLATLLALLLAYGSRQGNRWGKQISYLATLGYAVPGTVIAVSILIVFSYLGKTLQVGLLTGTIAGLVYAYLVRFLASALQSTSKGLERITPSMDEAAQSLGKNSLERLTHIHIPLLRGSLLTSALLVFVDVMKELPATLIVRPFNVSTLATEVYRLASDERLREASLPALVIVLVGILPVILFSAGISGSRIQSK